jgi:hypothetical protein
MHSFVAFFSIVFPFLYLQTWPRDLKMLPVFKRKGEKSRWESCSRLVKDHICTHIHSLTSMQGINCRNSFSMTTELDKGTAWKRRHTTRGLFIQERKEWAINPTSNMSGDLSNLHITEWDADKHRHPYHETTFRDSRWLIRRSLSFDIAIFSVIYLWYQSYLYCVHQVLEEWYILLFLRKIERDFEHRLPFVAYSAFPQIISYPLLSPVTNLGCFIHEVINRDKDSRKRQFITFRWDSST